MVVIVFGLPGSGKSYFAMRLADKLKAEYVNSDRLRTEMFRKSSYSDQEKAMVYNTMLSKAENAIRKNKHIVLDGTFHKQEMRALFKQTLGTVSDLFFIEVEAHEELIRQRLKKERPFSEADFQVYLLILDQWEKFDEPHLLLQSTDENIDSMLKEAEEYLNLKR